MVLRVAVIYPPAMCCSCVYLGTGLLGNHGAIPRPFLAKVGL